MVERSLPVEVTVNPDTLEVTLPYLASGALIQSAAGAETELAPCQNSRAMQVLPISGKIELAHSSVPEVHLEVQSRPNLNQEKEDWSNQERGDYRVEGEVGEEFATRPESATDLLCNVSKLAHVSDYRYALDDVERKDGGLKESEKGHISNPHKEATGNRTPSVALENESLLPNKDPVEVRDEIEDLDEKMALRKAKLDNESSEEVKVVKSAVANPKDQSSEDVSGLEEERVDDEDKVVVEKHIEECIESVINTSQRDEVVVEPKKDFGEEPMMIECQGVDGVVRKSERQLKRRKMWSWI